jgi:hypothetical protein
MFFSDLNESSYAIEKVIGEWSQVIDKVGNFRSEFGEERNFGDCP